jgi:large subunit ribosomal protein L6
MSRIGKKPINVPTGVEVTISGHSVTAKGPKGLLKRDLPAEVKIAREKDVLQCSIPENSEKRVRSLYGLTRSLLANMITGVHTGYTRELEVVGLGYKIKQDGPKVILNMGLSHPVSFDPPKDITVKVEGTNKIVVSGPDKMAVGQVASEIRKVRPPEVYKGTGIRYAGEKVRIKEGKKLAA